MKTEEDLILKWLDNNLTKEDQEAFEQLDADGSLRQLADAAHGFKAPEIDTSKSIERLLLKKKTTQTPGFPWMKYITRIAAILVISAAVYYSVWGSDISSYTAEVTKRTAFKLPDSSEVLLNASSSLSFSEDDWNKSRDVDLVGEAYFKVAKGSKFTVRTTTGNVSVLGTQFNVKERDNYFEVTCYEGLVEVTYKGQSKLLPAGTSLRIINGQFSADSNIEILPSWVVNKSNFKSVPLSLVLDEIERQYGVTIVSDERNSSLIFTGSFTHDDLDTALKAISIPTGLIYFVNKRIVTLKKEN